jgi:hypothetical protein
MSTSRIREDLTIGRCGPDGTLSLFYVTKNGFLTQSLMNKQRVYQRTRQTVLTKHRGAD